jgi:hypothetical protein
MKSLLAASAVVPTAGPPKPGIMSDAIRLLVVYLLARPVPMGRLRKDTQPQRTAAASRIEARRRAIEGRDCHGVSDDEEGTGVSCGLDPRSPRSLLARGLKPTPFA